MTIFKLRFGDYLDGKSKLGQDALKFDPSTQKKLHENLDRLQKTAKKEAFGAEAHQFIDP